MIDAHTHLYSDKYSHDLDQVIQRARKLLEAVVISAVDGQSLQKSLEIRRRYSDFIYVTAGIHPRQAAVLADKDRRHVWQTIGRCKDQIVAVGEVGPDFHYIKDKHRQRQQLEVLEEALNRATARNLPLVVHARNAEAQALELLAASRTPVMFHCFAGSKQMALEVAAHGFYLSFSAILLFRSDLQEAVSLLPLEQILTETDSPALSPRRDHLRNEPVFMQKIVSCLSKLLEYPVNKTAKITAANARRFYGLPCIKKT